MNKSEREELRRLLRARFKLLRTDVDARKAELEVELQEQAKQATAAAGKAYDDLKFQLGQAVDEANRKANDLCRELYGREEWGEKYDKTIVGIAVQLPTPWEKDRRMMIHRGRAEIEARVRKALLELARQENELLTELATSALESADSRAFFARIPSVSELVPSYRLKELAQ